MERVNLDGGWLERDVGQEMVFVYYLFKWEKYYHVCIQY